MIFQGLESTISSRRWKGLFGTPTSNPVGVKWNDLNFDARTSKNGGRTYEMLYCECCGDLLIGGTRFENGAGSIEMLPHEGVLENLPESAATRLFEERSFKDYVLFWPVSLKEAAARCSPPSGQDETNNDCWTLSLLHPPTGRIVVNPRGSSQEGWVPGWLYVRSEGSEDGKGRDNSSSGTHAPFACPSCGIDHSRRPKPRFSPIRHFRTGFGKTSQLLTDELFSLIRLGLGDEARLVSFSDSRQEAAKAAIDLESGHRTDLKRELLVHALEACREARRSPETIKSELLALNQKIMEDPSDTALGSKIPQLQQELASSSIPAIALTESLPDPGSPIRYQGLAGHGRAEPGKYLEAMVGLGVHPFDDLGLRRIKVGEATSERTFTWSQLFRIVNSGEHATSRVDQNNVVIDWNDDAIPVDGKPVSIEEINQAREKLLQAVWLDLGETLFANNYYALEEAGVGAITLNSFLPTVLPESERPRYGSAHSPSWRELAQLRKTPLEHGRGKLIFGRLPKARLNVMPLPSGRMDGKKGFGTAFLGSPTTGILEES